ncbi:PfkB family carbohydrate kinase [Jiella mangrovi]|uniref:Sugar kinase n=1 Tax=Jiella mangrovi TaxID=2821407 RepID=A0ABS4BMT7_9HYPH|nr:PfkB family carbohydrate kinase [Jiella mangrovi]MBP0618014.1 sugar kinase [Jiella mangrovi]
MIGDAPTWAHGQARVACLGLSALDYIFVVDELPGRGSAKVRAGDFAVKGGGMAATAAVTVARLGGAASFIGRAGADREGEMMRAELSAEGVDVTHFKLFEDARSSISGIFVGRNGERQIANFRGAALPVEADWLPSSAFAGLGAVLCDPRWPEGAHAAFAACRDLNIPTILDGDVATDDVFDALLPLTDHAIFSEPALAAYAGRADEAGLREVAERHGCAVTAVTLGEAGAISIEGGDIRHASAFAIEAVDTTGAGDVFHGAYAYAIARQAPTAEAMTFASAVAALKCTRPDGRSGIPTLQASLSFWRTHS